MQHSGCCCSGAAFTATQLKLSLVICLLSALTRPLHSWVPSETQQKLSYYPSVPKAAIGLSHPILGVHARVLSASLKAYYGFSLPSMTVYGPTPFPSYK